MFKITAVGTGDSVLVSAFAEHAEIVAQVTLLLGLDPRDRSSHGAIGEVHNYAAAWVNGDSVSPHEDTLRVRSNWLDGGKLRNEARCGDPVHIDDLVAAVECEHGVGHRFGPHWDGHR